MRLHKVLILMMLIQLELLGQESSEVNRISIGENFEIQSKILGETREIYIYQPQGLWGMDENMTNLPVIYVLDAESQFSHTATTVDFLSIATNGNDFMPRSIVVGIATINNRVRDLTPVVDSKFTGSGGGTQFLDFITSELIPYIEENYKTSSHRTIIGHSLGGLMTLEALLRKRECFDNYIVIDPASGFANEKFINEVIDTLNQSDLAAENVFLSAANNRPMFLSKEDMMSDTSEFMKGIDIANQKFISAHRTKDWKINLTTKYYDKENHYSVPLISTSEGLRELYNYYTFPIITNYYHPEYQDSTDLVKKIKDHYSQISNRMGYEVKPMQGYINSFASGLAHFNGEDIAIDLLEYNIELYPKDSKMYNNLGYFYLSNGHNQKAIELFTKSLSIQNDAEILQTINELHKRSDHHKRR